MFVDLSGCELHTINDPKDPVHRQEITRGSDRMGVESVMASSMNILCSRANCGGRLSTGIHTVVDNQGYDPPTTTQDLSGRIVAPTTLEIGCATSAFARFVRRGLLSD